MFAFPPRLCCRMIAIIILRRPHVQHRTCLFHWMQLVSELETVVWIPFVFHTLYTVLQASHLLDTEYMMP